MIKVPGFTGMFVHWLLSSIVMEGNCSQFPFLVNARLDFIKPVFDTQSNACLMYVNLA